MKTNKLEVLVKSCLARFYERRIAALESLDLNTEQFKAIERSLRATLRRFRKQFIPIMGCGYGKVSSPPTTGRGYYKFAGQAFWARVTGDPDFYLKLVQLMRNDPDGHRQAFKEAWDRAVNRFVRQFSGNFCDNAGNILWEELVKFNSGMPP